MMLITVEGSKRVMSVEMYSSHESSKEMTTRGHSTRESLPNKGICILGGY